MLTLMLLRHAKAEPLAQGDDFDRALTDQGKADAARLGGYLAKSGYVPTMAFVSAAKRTTQTFEIVTRATGSSIPVRYEDALFNATPAEMRGIVVDANAVPERLMIVGHNPGIMDAALGLVGDGDLTEIAQMRSRFPPCSTAIITFAAETWQDAFAGNGRLECFVMPEDLL